MRRLTANEVNEIAEVFKATLEACTSSKKTGQEYFDWKNWKKTTIATIDGQEVDLATLPPGATVTNGSNVSFKSRDGWRGMILGEVNGRGKDVDLAQSLAEDNFNGHTVRFIYNPLSPGSPTATAYFEDEEELRKAFIEDGFIDFEGHQFPVTLYRKQEEEAVIVVNGTGIYGFLRALTYVRNVENRTPRPKTMPEEFAQYGFPLRLDLYLSPYEHF